MPNRDDEAVEVEPANRNSHFVWQVSISSTNRYRQTEVLISRCCSGTKQAGKPGGISRFLFSHRSTRRGRPDLSEHAWRNHPLHAGRYA